jgi:chemotaxis protein CheD
MQMNSRSKTVRFNPAALPLEYIPKIADVTDSRHAKHYLIPGKIFVSADAVAVSTIVGTGVSVCLWDQVRRVGGINHFLLPTNAEGFLDNTKYADAANHSLLQELIQLGADPRSMEARVFGGSQPSVTFSSSTECLGDRNVQIALDFLGRRNIRLVEKEVGGTRGRKLIFQTDDGRTWNQQL